MLPIVPEVTSIKPTITGFLDTVATLTAGFMPYIFEIVENYPELVVSIMWIDIETGYDPVTLSGVCVKDALAFSKGDNKCLSIELPEVVTFHTPCRTKVENKATTLSVSIGKFLS